MATLPAPAKPANGQSSGAAAAVVSNPFSKASKRKTEPFLEWDGSLTAAAQNIPQADVPADGYLRHIVLEVTGGGTVGATYDADAPWSVFSQVQLNDVNGQPIAQLSGYDLFLANLFGGYSQHADPRYAPDYSLTATGYHFFLRIPVEIVQRNALGALTNMNAAMTYKVRLQLAPKTEVYTAGDAGNTISVRGTVETWGNPPAADVHGIPNTTTPPALGTTQNWSEYVKATTVGLNTIRLPRVGNTIRNLIFVNRDVAGARTSAGLPVEVTRLMDGNQVTRNTMTYERQRIGELFNMAGADIPAGVWLACFTDDFDGTPGEEIGDYWLQTSGGTRLEIQGQWTAAGSLTVITNDILAFAGNGGAGQTVG